MSMLGWIWRREWLAISALFLLAGCAQSTSPLASATPLELAFVHAAPTWDIDHDGVVTCDEWRRYAGQLFDEADRGRKGYLDKDAFVELAKLDRLFVTADFNYFDQNRDGRVDRAEFIDKPNPAFRLLDRNNDCQLTTDELRLSYIVSLPSPDVGGGSNSGKNRRPGS